MVGRNHGCAEGSQYISLTVSVMDCPPFPSTGLLCLCFVSATEYGWAPSSRRVPSPVPCVTCINLVNFHNSSIRVQILLLAHSFYKRKLKHRKIDLLPQDHTASKWQSRDSTRDSTPEPTCSHGAPLLPVQWPSVSLLPCLNKFLNTRIFTL